MAADFGEEEGRREEGHVGHAVAGLRNLHSDLVLEEFGVLECGLVEDEGVREGGDYEVDEGAGKPGNVRNWLQGDIQRNKYHMMRNNEMNCRYALSLGNWLFHAASRGVQLRYLLAGVYCHGEAALKS